LDAKAAQDTERAQLIGPPNLEEHLIELSIAATEVGINAVPIQEHVALLRGTP
jgi:hypothetical protein